MLKIPFIVSFVALLGVAGCANPSPQTALAMTEQALIAAENAELIYVRLPACIVSGQPACSEKAVIDEIKKADAIAFAAVMSAREAPSDNTKAMAAAAAITVLVALVPFSPAPR